MEAVYRSWYFRHAPPVPLRLPISNVYYYVDFCKEDGIYTLQSFDLYGDGWQKNHGYTMTVDVGVMKLDVEELKDGSPKPLSVTTVFSTFIPSQIEYTDSGCGF